MKYHVPAKALPIHNLYQHLRIFTFDRQMDVCDYDNYPSENRHLVSALNMAAIIASQGFFLTLKESLHTTAGQERY